MEVLVWLGIGSIPMATLISLKLNKPLAILRKKPKEDIRKKLSEGACINDKK